MSKCAIFLYFALYFPIYGHVAAISLITELLVILHSNYGLRTHRFLPLKIRSSPYFLRMVGNTENFCKVRSLVTLFFDGVVDQPDAAAVHLKGSLVPADGVGPTAPRHYRPVPDTSAVLIPLRVGIGHGGTCREKAKGCKKGWI